MSYILDISANQGKIDWDKLNPHLDFVFFRAVSMGINLDKYYIEYTNECAVPFGAYSYVTAGTTDAAREQAKFLVEYADKAKRAPTCYVADIECKSQNEKTTESVCAAFLNELRAQGCDKIGLYIGQTRYEWAKKAIEMADFIWIPRYGKDDGNIPEQKYTPKYYCDIWQYTSQGHVPGINTNVDINMLYGDKPLFYFTEKYPIIKQGNTGEYVKFLQKVLVAHGYESFLAPWGADGDFGKNTLNAVIDFQKQQNLEVDGIVGKATWETLFAQSDLFTAIIPNLSKAQTNKLLLSYPNAIIT